MIVYGVDHKDWCKSRVASWDQELDLTHCRECGALMEESETDEIPDDLRLPDELLVGMEIDGHET